MSPIMGAGFSGGLKQEDLWTLQEKDQAEHVSAAFKEVRSEWLVRSFSERMHAEQDFQLYAKKSVQ